ncbi:MAG: autotransporter domain-containing protein, partial [Methylotenera sp.]
VNTINITSNTTLNGNFTANGLGVNILNQTCLYQLAPTSQEGCVLSLGANDVTGFSTYTLSGSKFVLGSNINVTDEINLNAGIIVLGTSTLTAPRVVISNSTLLQTPGNAFVVGNLENSGTINLNNNTLSVDGNTSMNAGSKLQVNITPQSNGKIENTGTATFAANSTLIPEVRISDFGVNTNVRNGEVRTIANNVSGIPIIQNNNGLLQWVASANTGDLVITANIGVTNFLAPKLSVAANNAVSALFAYTGSDTLFSGLQAQMIAQHDENLIHAAERLHPETNDGAFRMVQGNTDKVFGILETRMLGSYLTTSPESTQVATNGSTAQLGSASNLASGNAVWVQGFGDRGAQSNAKGVDGYSSSAAGFALGIDKPLDEAGNKRLGFALGYTRGNVTDTGNTVGNRTDINSFLGAAYGSLVMEDWYVNGMLGVGRNTYDTYRRLIENTATGNHDSWQFSGRVDVGMPILFSDNLTFVPMASLDYSHIKESGYIESGESLTPVLDSTTRPELPPQQVYVNGIPQFNQGVSLTPFAQALEAKPFTACKKKAGGQI